MLGVMSEEKKKPAAVVPDVAVETPTFVAYPVVPEVTARPARVEPPPPEEEEEESLDDDELEDELDEEGDDDGDEDEDGDGASRPAATFLQPLTPSPEFARIVGAAPLTRVEAVKRLWEHIKKNGLQDRKNPRNINADEALRAVLGRDSVSMFEMTTLVMRHLS